jgi:hypothetical protein
MIKLSPRSETTIPSFSSVIKASDLVYAVSGLKIVLGLLLGLRKK